jgi:acyl-CoA reductase-like NAD-dependent aldehyde dehydrogenase
LNIITDTNWHQYAKDIKLETRAFIDGRFVDAISGQTFERINPATGKHLAHIAACDVADVDVAVRAARAAFESGVWRDLKPTERKRIMLRGRIGVARDAGYGQTNQGKCER